VVYIGEKNAKFGDLVTGVDFDKNYWINAGKFRRYHNESWLKRLFDLKTNAQNFRDLFLFLVGYIQAWRLLGHLKPQLIFVKGGFVGVPVGLAAKVRGIPFITHDSDVLPGLANRIIGRWAAAHAVGMPKELYTYPSSNTYFVGTPVARTYQLVTQSIKAQYRQILGYNDLAKIVFITGGSLGSTTINGAVLAIAEQLLSSAPNTYIIHQTGKGNTGLYDNLPTQWQKNVFAQEYFDDQYRYSAIADVVIARAGATTIAELAVQGKACIFIPNPLLTGGHQTKNGEFLSKKEAGVIIQENDLRNEPDRLKKAVQDLLTNSELRNAVSYNLSTCAVRNATEQLSSLLIKYLNDKPHEARKSNQTL